VNLGVIVSAFLAASIEVIEMVAIVVAVGVARSWRSSLAGAAGGLVVLVVLVAVLGTALRNVPLAPLRFEVGSLLLLFGLQWLRKGVFRVARDGWAVGVGDEDVEGEASGGMMDWTAFVLSFKGVSLEGLEVAVIVVAFGSAARATGSAAIGAAGAVVLIGALGLATYRAVARIPRRALQLFVGAMLVTFGTFWSGQGLGVSWPGHEFALLWLGAGYLASALVLLRLVMNWRRAALTAAQRPTVSGVQP
jgi:Ca2+/H+ antiporter, TMEM165/GDT1 family